MSKAMILDHPLVQHKVSLLRDKNTGTKEFKALVSELAMLLCYEATRDLPTKEVSIETPVAMAQTRVLSGRKLALVPILRAGLGMVDGMLALIPAAKVGHIGLYRNEETLEPVEYYCKLPKDIAEREVIVLDPMLATGGSAIDAITQIKKRGAKSIKFIGIIGAPEGLERLKATHPDVDIYLAALDEKLNENGYIVPGLGDAGANGGPAGDLIVLVSVRPDTLFERDGYDVHVTVPITYSQAVTGADVVVPTIDGKVQYTVPEGTQSGTVFRLRGKGIQYVNGRGHGDQYVKVVVEIPKKLTKTQREALRAFEDTLKDDNYEQRKGFFKHLREKFEGK